MPKIASKIEPTFEGAALDADRISETANAKIMTAGERGQVSTLPVPVEGFEVRLAGIAGAIIDVDDRLVERSAPDGSKVEFGNKRYAGRVDIEGALSVNGISETFDWTYESRLTGGIGAVVDDADRIIAIVSPSAPREVDLAGYEERLIGRHGAMVDVADRVISFIVDPNSVEREIDLSGFESRLLGFAGALVDARDRVISYIRQPALEPKETDVFGFEARLLGKPGALVDAQDHVISWYYAPDQSFGSGYTPDLPSTDLAVFGDSIGAPGSGIADFLAALLPKRVTYRESIGGQRAYQIFRRQGGVPTTGILDGNAIPASGPIAVTGIYLYMGSGNRAAAVEIVSADGTAVPGVLNYVSSTDTYAFTRNVAGSAVPVPNPAVIVIKSGMQGATTMDALRAATQVWVAGRNDAGKSTGSVPEGAFNMKNLLAYMSQAMAFTTTKRVAICGVTNGQADKMAADGGTSYLTTPQSSWDRFKQVEWMNKAYRATYPDRFIDWMAIHEAEGLTEPYTVNGETFQVIKAEATYDGLHPDDIIGKPLRAQATKDFLIAKGW